MSKTRISHLPHQGKTLIIAEKPSVANDIARALGGFTRHGDYFENDQYVLSSAIGHLLEIKAPEAYEVKRGKWSFAHLPVIPPHFDLRPIAKTEARLRVLIKLIKRKDIDTLINACDAGREGELIFRTIVQHARAKQPIKRLWLQSMTPSAIREGFAHLRSDQDMQPLAHAASCRCQADWLVGINGTRAMTAFNNKSRVGGFFLTPVGRVQTPTLSLVVEREEKIRRFVPQDYWEVKADFICATGRYTGLWFDPQFKKNGTRLLRNCRERALDKEAGAQEPECTGDHEDSEPRPTPYSGRAGAKRDSQLFDLSQAEAIVAACRGKTGTASEVAKRSTQLSPPLFDLTSLQREANSRFGFSAKSTLAIAQALYERHKVLTYPRTDSRALPEDYLSTVEETMELLSNVAPFAPFATRIRQHQWVRPHTRIFNNAKVSDHFAIIPTLAAPSSLSDIEEKLYALVTKRFLAVFFPAAEYQLTQRITQVGEHHFRTEGKILKSAGWLQIYRKEMEDSEEQHLAPITPHETVGIDRIEAQQQTTRPPARYNEATLLTAMESAGKRVEDDELRAAMSSKGLGTPATRAAIIEGLLTERYLLREGREILPTAKAFQLITLLRGLGVKELTAPELTGEWEFKLAQIEQGHLQHEVFMRDIAQMTQTIVNRAKAYDSDTVPGDYATLTTPCPNCGGVVKENYQYFACTACDFSIVKALASRQLEIDEAQALLQNKQIGPLSGFLSRAGRPFAALLKLVQDDTTRRYSVAFDFQERNSQDADANGAPISPDFSNETALGTCPKCSGRVFEYRLSYLCENTAMSRCDFRSGTIILQQPITRTQMEKLLSVGRTDLLTGFKSSRTGRAFKAFLVKQKDGKIGFEFEKSPTAKKQNPP